MSREFDIAVIGLQGVDKSIFIRRLCYDTLDKDVTYTQPASVRYRCMKGDNDVGSVKLNLRKFTDGEDYGIYSDGAVIVSDSPIGSAEEADMIDMLTKRYQDGCDGCSNIVVYVTSNDIEQGSRIVPMNILMTELIEMLIEKTGLVVITKLTHPVADTGTSKPLKRTLKDIISNPIHDRLVEMWENGEIHFNNIDSVKRDDMILMDIHGNYYEMRRGD